MTTRRAIKGVLHDFLGSFTSRNSDYRGYWLLGQLLPEPEQRELDLIGRPTGGGGAWGFARDLALRLFQEQVLATGLGLEDVDAATLEWCRGDGVMSLSKKNPRVIGYRVRLRVRATMVGGRCFERHVTLDYVSPRDPRRDRRSTRSMLFRDVGESRPSLSLASDALRAAIEELLAGDPCRDAEEREMVQRHGALPVCWDLFSFVMLRPDGEKLIVDDDGNVTGSRSSADVLRTLVLAAERYPSLRWFLPERNAEAVEYRHCGGSGEWGKRSDGSAGTCPGCAGLGWTLPDD
ncbi:MAG: hypothetical protein AAF533_12925 [Acidobacteriota bacterium]